MGGIYASLFDNSTGPAGPDIEVIQGDVGSVTGHTIQLYANSGSANAGSTVKFASANGMTGGTEMDLVVTDSNGNTIIGQSAGNNALIGNANTVLGFEAGQGITGDSNTFIGWKAGILCTGGNNIALGQSTLAAHETGTNNTAINGLGNLVSGSYNTSLGSSAGSAYTTNESSNICIQNSGVILDNNVTRIGTQGSGNAQQNECFIAGIVGVTVSNQKYVTINSSTGQLGITDTFEGNYTQTPISYQVLTTDSIIGVSSTAAPRTITMPNSGMVAGQVWTIKDESGAAGTNNITVSGNGVNIDGASTFVISNNYGSIDLYWNGTKFFIK